MNRNDHYRPDRHTRDPFVIESTKISEITDKFGHTRYKVILTDFDKEALNVNNTDGYDDIRRYDQRFVVEVWCYVIDEDPFLVFSSGVLGNYNDALKLFYNKVDIYSAFIKAETKEVQNIYIYSDKIHYHIIDPDCCATCKFAKPMPNCCELYSRNKIGKFECTNHSIFNPIGDVNSNHDLANVDDPGYGLTNFDNVCYDSYNYNDHYMPLHPEVAGNGICDFFERKEDK